MGAFWKSIGVGLAKVGVYATKSALWASKHPEVVNIVKSVAKQR